jgi:two-component system OmpR family response regulator
MWRRRNTAATVDADKSGMEEQAIYDQRVATVLVVDDDASLRAQICAYLAEHGFTVVGARDATQMDQLLRVHPVDVVILDVMMPGEDGLSVCRRLSETHGPAVVMLSAMGADVDKIVGLELGADDYLPKPCNPRELVARVRAVVRRREDQASPSTPMRSTYAFSGFRLEVARRRLRGPNGVTILLTGGEFSMLSTLLSEPHRVFSREELIERSRGSDSEVFDRAIDVQISRLRRKLQSCSDECLIITYRGAGYSLKATVTRL